MKPCCRKAITLGSAFCLVCGLALGDVHDHTKRASDYLFNPGKVAVQSNSTADRATADEAWVLNLQALAARWAREASGANAAALRLTLRGDGDDFAPPSERSATSSATTS
ncbi:MAG TPA: hypothetical protein VGU74_00465 [Gemmatimonadales bacterium]|nr:hypothetical protein [Gemmatimonadales bacterium]